MRAHRGIEEALSLGEFRRAQATLTPLLESDPANFRTVQLFAEVQLALGEPAAVQQFVGAQVARLDRFPPTALVALADALDESDPMVKTLYRLASVGRHELRSARRIAGGLKRWVNAGEALDFVRDQLQQHPQWADDAPLLQVWGDALIEQAEVCSNTAARTDVPRSTRERAKRDCRRLLGEAETQLRRAASRSPDARLAEQITRNLEFVEQLRTRVDRGARSR